MLYTLLFVGVAVLEVMGMIPQEIKSSGITIEGILSKYFGDEDMHFIYFHMRRTTVMTVLHCFLPLLYCIGLHWSEPSLSVLTPWRASPLIQALLVVSVMVAVVGCTLGYWWHRSKWSNHPIAASLSLYNQPWREVAANINLEYRRFEKFVNNLGNNTVIVTESWIIKATVHNLYVAHQRNSHLVVSKTEEHELSSEGPTTSQYLTIAVNSINSASFSIRLNALQYGELKEKLHTPIREARGVIVQQTIGDMFTDAFKKQVEKNGVYNLPSSSPQPEACIGCLQIVSDVKLYKMCADDTSRASVCKLREDISVQQVGDCRQCFCRPMWCISCMAKWFASRQDQRRPEEWLRGVAPCPMCRSQFCALDVLQVRPNSAQV